MNLTLSIEKDGVQWRQMTTPTALRFSTGQNGSAVLSASWRMGIDEATLFHDTWSMAKATVSNGAEVVWTGRVEDIGVVANGVNITAFGYARAYADLLYTAVWSKDTVADFRGAARGEVTVAQNGRYNTDSNNRLYFELVRDEDYNDNNRGVLVYEFPDKGLREAKTISFDWEFENTTGLAYAMSVRGYSSNWTLIDFNLVFSSVATSGSGSYSLSFSPNVQKVAVTYYHNNATLHTYTGETGATWGKVTNIRIKSTTAATVLGSDIAADLAAFVATENHSQGDGLAYGIQATNQDLREQVFEDARPDRILQDICDRHDYRWRVWEQSLILEPEATSGVSHYADVTSMEFQRSFAEVYTQAYATYNTESNATLRTATATNTNATFLFNDVKKVETTGANTTDLATAEAQRDAVLVANGNLAPRIDIRITTLLTADGRVVPLWRVRAGDSIFIRAIPVDSRPILERRVLRVFRTDYNALTNELTVESDIPYPSLVTIVAKQGKTK
jgi:hypothetical protein